LAIYRLNLGTAARDSGSLDCRAWCAERARTTAWLQAGGRISAQLDASGALEVLYAYVTKSWVPDWALHRDGRLFRVITDHVGSVRLVVDADSGEVAQQYRYSPYGVLEEDITTEAIAPHRFAGGHYDEATGLLRFGARDYDPQVGRWTNKDPLGFAAGDTNLYAYVSGDPVNGVDPSGLFVDTLTDGIAVAGCLFALARDNIYGSCDNLGSNLGNCAIAAAAFVLPFVSYGMLGLGQRLGRRTARAPDLPCGAGLCPCFVAGTLVATLAMSSVAGADFNAYVDSNAPIESLQVGQRVLTALSDEHDIRESEVTSDWQVIDLELGDVDGQVLLTVLRPPEWLPHVDPDGDGTFELELPELRLRGLAHVIHVRGPPAIVDAPGRVVLSTVEHRVESVLALSFDDDSEVVTTPNHPFYSVSRGWTTAGELQLGEAVETPDGERTLASAEYQNAPQSVFNLEVEGDHEYLVGESGLRVHNNCGLDDLGRFRRELGLSSGDGTLARLEIGGEQFYGINAHGQSVSLRVNPISRTHAETDVFQQARNAGASGQTGRLVVDRELCGACGRSGAVRSMARQLGLGALEVVTPAGTSTLIP
jgi:RHS repeat-associated protein